MKNTAEMTLGSLFDGIAGFPLAARRQGIKTVWVSEIEPDCIDIAKRHFPEALQLGDITQIDGAKIPVVDIISFGSPCQDLSVAGRQAGLDGSRSGLFMEAVRITREMREKTNGQYPKYIIWENVAGAFSSNKGEDFRRVLTFSVPHGDCLTLNFGECPNVENVSTLSMILETDVPDKYFLSAKACWGIIRRAETRNKEIPVILKIALLERIAEEWQRTQTDK
ncbi:MAG: DNA cytosine methyltransferase [Roseburia hominis]|uniref:DNA cytosine methyltransferase n=1 Tax=Roseburia hominis TaxID=301301 RepID=UPI00290CA9A9|nr:DNA cytosine methyltransferase [Roseburia hominis]MDU6921851.1 DNA cytosine methyltransferase [Roseburia hominis]